MRRFLRALAREFDPRRAWRRWKVALGPTDTDEYRYFAEHGRLPEEDT